MIKDDTIYNIVNEVLRKYPATRDNYFLLELRVRIRMGFAKMLPDDKLLIDLKKIEFNPISETISRHARQIQNKERRYQPSPEVMLKRAKHQTRMHNKYSPEVRFSPNSRINTFPNSNLS